MSNEIKTGLLSYGMSGKLFHAPFLQAHQGFELSAVVERTTKQAYQKYSELISYDSVDALLTDQNIELVVVNTPNSTHFEFALKAIHHNKHVLVEKPFAVTSSEAKILYHEAEKNNRQVLAFQNRRYDSDFLSVKQVLDSGKLGQLIEAHFRFDRYKLTPSLKNAKESSIPGSGLLYDLGPHLLDGVISLFGSPLLWRKNLGHFRPQTKVDDYANIHLSYPDQLQVFITASLLVADEQPAFILHGTKGSYIKQRADVQEQQLIAGMNVNNASFGAEEAGMEGILTTLSENGAKKSAKIASEKSSYINLFNQVYKTIRDGKRYSITAAQIIKQLEILEAH
jgi:scyllo-inositol 2-dehydrogenase (NADP+)